MYIIYLLKPKNASEQCMSISGGRSMASPLCMFITNKLCTQYLYNIYKHTYLNKISVCSNFFFILGISGMLSV